MEAVKTKKRGRDPVVRDGLVEAVRSKLLAGEWGPGEKLPPRRWFEQAFDAASYTVQSAFDVLIEEGFLVSESRMGTRVSELPPYLNHYALCLSGTPGTRRLMTRSFEAAARLLCAEGRRIEVFYDSDRDCDNPKRLALLRRFRRHDFTGAFYVSLPEAPSGREQLWQLRNFPVVGNFGPDVSKNSVIGSPEVDRFTDSGKRLTRALADLGVRRGGVMQFSQHGEPVDGTESAYRANFSEAGMELAEYGYSLMFNIDTFCSGTLALFFRQFTPENPGGVILRDDNMVIPAVRTLRRLYGDRAERACRIVALGNHPAAVEVDFPIKWFYCDNLYALRSGLDFLDRWRRGAVRPGESPVLRRVIEDVELISLSTPKKGVCHG